MGSTKTGTRGGGTLLGGDFLGGFGDPQENHVNKASKFLYLEEKQLHKA